METRRLGSTGLPVSVITFGGVMLANVTDDVADTAVQTALDGGITLFDVSDDYGDSERQLGRWTSEIRERGGFISTKTTEREYDDAWAGINRSLELLGVDQLDVLHLHSVSTWQLLDQVTAENGAVKALLRAKEEGLTRFIGFTGHGHEVPKLHAEALRRVDLDVLLAPWNRALSRKHEYAVAFDRLLTLMAERDAGLVTIKAAARRNWKPDEEQHVATWYLPLEQQRTVTAAYAWNLNRHPFVCSAATPGEVSLLEAAITAERERANLTPSSVDLILDDVADLASPYENMPPGVV